MICGNIYRKKMPRKIGVFDMRDVDYEIKDLP